MIKEYKEGKYVYACVCVRAGMGICSFDLYVNPNHPTTTTTSHI